ncbi:MAG: amidohydrolase family protein, partial [Acidobacteria bacterium]|nr:amidohydrolase family protein [Acidobacteriota bacterium]
MSRSTITRTSSAAALLFAAATVTPGAQRTTDSVTAFTNVTVVDVRTGQLAPSSSIVVRGNRIVAVDASTRMKLPDGATVVDGRGAHVIPGLWDMHVHTFNNSQSAGTNNHAVAFALQIANGVTGVRDMWTDLDDIRLARDWRKETDAGRMVSPRLLATSPILDGNPPAWANSVGLASAVQAREVVDSLVAAGVEELKVYTRLTPDVYLAITERAKVHGIPVVGHPPASMRLTAVVEAGQKSIEHLLGIPGQCSSAPADAKQDAEGHDRQRLFIETYDPKRCAELFDLFIRKGTWVVPTVALHRNRLLGFEPTWEQRPGTEYVSAVERAAWTAAHKQGVQRVNEDKRRGPHRRAQLAFLLRLIGSMDRAGVKLLAGTDLGNPFMIAGFSLHEELALFVEAGMTPLNALRTATVNPARYMDAVDRLGAVEAGKLADFVLLDGNPLTDIHNTTRIRAVVTNGHHLD